MTEIEERLAKLGFPEPTRKTTVRAATTTLRADMRCEWKVERIELPTPDPAALASASPTGTAGPGGPLSALMGGQGVLQAAFRRSARWAFRPNTRSLSGDAGISGMASALKEGTGGGVGALAQLAMTIVYPTLKPMLEASIRKITVKVLWKEGIQKRDLSAIQYVTRPMRGDAITAAAAASGMVPGGHARADPHHARHEDAASRMTRGDRRGLTLLEVMVAVGILAMVSVLIYGAFDGLSRGKKNLGRVNDRYHQGRAALSRMARELSSAFLSAHQPLTEQQFRRLTISKERARRPPIASTSPPFRTCGSFATRTRATRTSSRISALPTPKCRASCDLARRESPVIDLEPKRGGEVEVLAEDIDHFDVRFLDATTGLWTESWDTSQATGQPNRLPFEIKLTLALKGGIENKPIVFVTKVSHADAGAAHLRGAAMKKKRRNAARRGARLGLGIHRHHDGDAHRVPRRGDQRALRGARRSRCAQSRIPRQKRRQPQSFAHRVGADHPPRALVFLARSRAETGPNPGVGILRPHPRRFQRQGRDGGDFAILTGTDLAKGKNLGIDGGRFDVAIIDEDSKLNVEHGLPRRSVHPEPRGPAAARADGGRAI